MKPVHEIDAGRIEFRHVQDTDAAFLRELYGSTRTEELSVVPWSDEQKSEFLDMQFKAQTSHYAQHYAEAEFLIILLNSEAAGRLYIDRWENEIRVIHIALLPACRRRGVGRCLLEDILAEATASNLKVTIHVEHNNPAMRLYKDLGFRQIGDTGVYFLMEWNGPAMD